MADLLNVPASAPTSRNTAIKSRPEASIAQAEAGELVNWDVVENWIESWGTEAEIPRPEPKRR
jgi:predicted transcriptional regulator